MGDRDEHEELILNGREIILRCVARRCDSQSVLSAILHQVCPIGLVLLRPHIMLSFRAVGRRHGLGLRRRNQSYQARTAGPPFESNEKNGA